MDNVAGSSALKDRPLMRRCFTPEGTMAMPSPASTRVRMPDQVEDVLTMFGEKPSAEQSEMMLSKRSGVAWRSVMRRRSSRKERTWMGLPARR